MYEADYSVGGYGAAVWLLIIAAYFYFAFAQYKIAQKVGCADKAWWSFVPILNTLLLITMAGKEMWWFLLCLVPFINIIVFAILWIQVAKVAGHSGVWGFLVLVPFLNLVAIGIMAFSGGSIERAYPRSGQITREPTQVG